MSPLDKFPPPSNPLCYRKMPTWAEIIEHLQDKVPSFFADTIVRTFLSKDRAKRIFILQNNHGYYRTMYEEIRVWDEDEWNYFYNDLDKYPASWEPVDSSINTKSFYGTEEDALKAIAESHEYEVYFA